MSEERSVRSLPSDPPCPTCGRRYARKFFKANAKKPSFHCDSAREIGGCDTRWDAN